MPEHALSDLVPALSDAPLRNDIRMLGNELGRVIRRHGGEALFDCVEEVRALAKARREGDESAERRLRERIASLDQEQLGELIRALALFFDLANLAEDRHRVRVLRERERAQHPEPRAESLGDAVRRLKSEGCSAEEVQSLLDRLEIELVFTAHPTEAKRRTVRYILRRLRQALIERDRSDLLPAEADRIAESIANDLTRLWQMDTLRPRRPTVLEEVGRGIYAAESVWDVVPRVMRDMRTCLARAYPGHDFRVPVFMRFGSWIGGDRDGNPLVTADITAAALQLVRTAALGRHIDETGHLMRQLSLSAKRHPVDPDLVREVAAARARWPELEAILDPISPAEAYRQWLSVIRFRLEQTLAARPFDIPADIPPGSYRDSAELARDVEKISHSLRSSGLGQLADAELQDWLDRIRVFGFHLTRLDIRENAEQLEDAVDELMRALGICSDFAGLDEDAKQRLLCEPLPVDLVRRVLGKEDAIAGPTGDTSGASSAGGANGADSVSDTSSASDTSDTSATGAGTALRAQTSDLLALLSLVHQVLERCGTEPLGMLVISMTDSPSDVLSMLWLTRLASVRAGGPDAPLPLPVVPLFETIADLKAAPDLLDALLKNPTYAAHLRALGNRQTCMIGYSDGTKDGGYLAANWHLYEAQRRLAMTAAKHGVRLTLFHGRGGALGRGGGPAARSILSLPPASLDGSIRITEQGEVLAERYDDPEIAYRHLEQVTWATLLMSLRRFEEPAPEWTRVMEKAADASLKAYRALITDPGFIPYFERATPIESIESLPIGSRPARRRGSRSLSTLRAIPFVFAWTQSRQLIPAFFGLGAGWASLDGPDRETLRRMYHGWPFFKAVIDNAELALAKCDMAIARHYAGLCRDQAEGIRVWEIIRSEYDRTVEALQAVTGRSSLLEGVPWLSRSVRVRNPYVDALNAIQIELFHRRRALEEAGADEQALESIEALLRLSVQGIAAGLRTTG